ncbi:hypothetical protein Tco_0619667 [Tanacetum coccineum]
MTMIPTTMNDYDECYELVDIGGGRQERFDFDIKIVDISSSGGQRELVEREDILLLDALPLDDSDSFIPVESFTFDDEPSDG